MYMADFLKECQLGSEFACHNKLVGKSSYFV